MCQVECFAHVCFHAHGMLYTLVQHDTFRDLPFCRAFYISMDYLQQSIFRLMFFFVFIRLYFSNAMYASVVASHCRFINLIICNPRTPVSRVYVFRRRRCICSLAQLCHMYRISCWCNPWVVQGAWGAPRQLARRGSIGDNIALLQLFFVMANTWNVQHQNIIRWTGCPRSL